ncbi:MAG TPA: helix-turn-helix domain-containing protein [Egicoccus sp.]|nr:helix-turn-helix domain-containing protein [Egicoccus sp.]HSK22493.1 helix-turn-helix domain-containing protein [Egicoccus sp.]
MARDRPYTVGMPKRVDLSAFECSVARTLDIVGDKWTLLILRDAFYGVSRFEDFTRDLGIARNVLTTRLTTLVDHGVLERVPYETHPPRHEYRLTEKGRALFPVLLTMMHWGDTWQPEDGDVPVTIVHRDCGATTHAVTVCAACAQPMGPGDVRVDPLPPVVEEWRAARRAAESA